MSRIMLKWPKIKPLAERNRMAVGAVGTLILVALIIAVFSYDKIPFIKGTTDYSAYFSEAGGIKPDSDVRVSGLSVGRVSGIHLDGNKVLVDSPSATASSWATAPRRRSRPKPCSAPSSSRSHRVATAR
jgi:phospholipid/cholesterol/gamma-HCH transport system substrate-binding protein